MSRRLSDTPTSIFRRSSASELSPYSDITSDPSQNMGRKRPRDEIPHEDNEQPPQKRARLASGCRTEQKQPQQLPDPVAFVDGPGHIIFIDERGKRCPAICFNECLLSNIKQIAVLNREVAQKDELFQKAQIELEQIQSSIQSTSLEEAKRAVQAAIKHQEDIEAGYPGLVEAQRRCKTLTQENKWPKLILESTRRIAQVMIEQILSTENLMNLPSSQPQQPASRPNWGSRDPAPNPEQTIEEVPVSSEPERSPTWGATKLPPRPLEDDQITPHQLALRKLRFAAEEVAEYQEGLTYMQQDYPHELAARRRYHQQSYPDRPASATQTDDDLDILQKTQHATRLLIQAEEAYDRAEQHAVDVGLGDIVADPQACYYGEIYNEFPRRVEYVLAMSPADRARVEEWMASVPDPAGVEAQGMEGDGLVEVDDWDARSVEVFDSVSLFATDVYRKKIDKWHEISGRCREGEGAIVSGKCAAASENMRLV